MATFSASTLDTIDYDLTAYRPDPDAPDLTDEERAHRRSCLEQGRWAGRVPEPSTDKIRAFMHALQDTRLEVAELETKAAEAQRAADVADWRAAHPDAAERDEDGTTHPTDDELGEFLTIERMRANIAATQHDRAVAAERQRERIIAAIAEFTDHTPGEDVLQWLPYRPLEHFLGWLTGQFSPEGVRAASLL